MLYNFPMSFLSKLLLHLFFHSFFLTGIFSSDFFLFFGTDLFILPSPPPFPHIDFCVPSSIALCAIYQIDTRACAPVVYSILSARSSESN